MIKKPLYSVVIPVYRSEKILYELYSRLINVFNDTINEAFEIIFVDDASPDDSWLKLKELNKKDKRIKVIRLARNFGQQCALMCGFNYISGEYVITMDDDLQHPPEEIPKLITAMHEKPELDVVAGSYETKKHSWWRNIGTIVMRKIMNPIIGVKKDYRGTSFRLVRATAIRDIVKMTTYQPSVGRLLHLVTNNYENVSVKHDARKHGRSGYSFVRLVKDFINNILNNSALVLRFTSIIGFSSACISLMLALYYMLKYFLSGVSVSGFTTIVVINLFFSGIVLFSLGVVGEYLMRILFETRRYPQFVVKHKYL